MGQFGNQKAECMKYDPYVKRYISLEDYIKECYGGLPSESMLEEQWNALPDHPEDSIYAQIINRFGREVQINKIQEEALELALVLNQMNCPTDLTEELYGELADMKIMMAQAEILFDKQKIDRMVEFKLNQFKEKYL